MNKDLTCNQVSALINFYIEGKLNPRLREYIDQHISKCPACRKKIQELQKILDTFKANSRPKQQITSGQTDFEFKNKLSAYVDNELNNNENIKIKKITITNPTARKELEMMYKFKQIMHSAYEKTKTNVRYDYSKNILTKIQDSKEYTTTYFYKLTALFVILIAAIITGFIYLYF